MGYLKAVIMVATVSGSGVIGYFVARDPMLLGIMVGGGLVVVGAVVTQFGAGIRLALHERYEAPRRERPVHVNVKAPEQQFVPPPALPWQGQRVQQSHWPTEVIDTMVEMER